MSELVPSATRGDADAVERIAQDLLLALDSLSIVYECAESFSRLFDAEAIAGFTLERVLEAVDGSRGVVLLEEGGRLVARAECGGCASALRPGAARWLAERPSAGFAAPGASAELLYAEVEDAALLHAPLSDGRRRFGCIVLLAAPGASFTTADLKLVTAVSSQAAIALGGCYHFAAVLLERAKLQSVIQDNAEGIVVLEPDGREALANAAARLLLELDGLQDAADSGADLLTRIERGWGGAEGLRALACGEPAELRLELTRGEGRAQRVLACAARALRGVDGRVSNLLLSLHDLTAERREERLKRSFLALISHKLRTPLASVKGILAMLQDETSAYAPSAAERQELLGAVDERVDELTSLLDRLLAMVEVLDGRWAALGVADLRATAEQVRTAMAPRAEQRSISVAVAIDEEARSVSLPESRLRLVLENLLDNALKFGARPGGRIELSARRGADGCVEIECADDGPGLSRREGELLFELFQQRDLEFTGSVPGLGIGLALVREIARNAGGTAELVGGEGSRFRVRLPGPS